MVNEVLDCLSVRPGGVYVDGTVGSGGHARAVLDRGGAGTALLGFDRDGEALIRAGRALEGADGKVDLRHGNFADLLGQLCGEGRGQVDGVLLDLGVSSEQLDAPERGFSFMRDGPLDMRMNQSSGVSAAELVNSMSEPELAGTIAAYGEERASRRIARAIVTERRRHAISTTLQLAAVIEKAVGAARGRIHPATRTFQALRIAVNGELDDLRRGLQHAILALRPGGRLAVISFHSLEDRIVKQFMAGHAGRWVARQEGGTRWVGDTPPARQLTRRPMTPSEPECAANPRARSAKLRAIERLSEPCGQSGGMRS
jgi:16S rRNA (cytosine1402-N4)-methyltransferase